MATTVMPTMPGEIASSLTTEQIPTKLRCSGCNQLAVNAFRLPCCDTSICETCHGSMTDACPICLHVPVTAEDCKINKTLRTTIKAFLRKKGIERDQALKKELASRAPSTPAAPDNTTITNGMSSDAVQSSTALADDSKEQDTEIPKGSREASEVRKSVGGIEPKPDETISSAEAQMDIPRPSVESANANPQAIDGGEHTDPATEQQEQIEQQEQEQPNLGTPEGQQSQDEMSKMQEQWAAMNASMQGMSSGGFGYDGMGGGFPNLAFSTPADYAQMMQYMQNGMTGAFPNMMSMTGMGMNPMAMAQGMYGGYNGQSMGMNGMNAGMGFANGQGAYGGYSGQPTSWNAGQHNYNQNAYGGHANGMVGDYGSNTGYGGYNMSPHQGNFNQMNNRNFSNNDFQNGYHGQGYQRGRGRGRGYQNYGRGRGAYHQVNSVHQTNHEAFHQQLPQQVPQQGSGQSSEPHQEQYEEQRQTEITAPGDANADSAEAKKAADEFAKSLDPGDAEDNVEVPDASAIMEEQSKAALEHSEPISKPQEPSDIDIAAQVEEASEKPVPIETFVSSEPQEPETTKINSTIAASTAMPPPPSPVVPTGPAALSSTEQPQHHDYGSRGKGRGYHGANAVYRGGLRGRGSGILPNGNSPHLSNGHTTAAPTVPPVIPTEPKGLGVEGAPKGPKAMMEGLSSNSVNGGKGFSIVGRASAAAQARAHGHSRDRSPSPTHSCSRSRSRSPSRSHHRRYHRHRSSDSSYDSDRDRKRERRRRRSRKYEDEELDEDADSKGAGSSSRRSKHHHRDDEKEKDPGRSGHRSHRSHRDRSRERDDKHRSSRKRSRSPDVDDDRSIPVNGATHTESANPFNGDLPTGPKADRIKAKEEKIAHSGRKRREREDEDEYGRDRKRSKPEITESFEHGDDRRSIKRVHRVDTDKLSHRVSQSPQEKAPEKSQPPTPTSATDPHTLEREARNRERMQKELQRRSAVDIKGSGPKRKMSGAMPAVRRVSYKYEDEESSEARTSRVESEREASRWG